MNSSTDYLIIGQGIAGTMLSYHLYKKGRSFRVIDDDNPYSATRVSSGIINPITGRRFVKTWRFDELYRFAKKIYIELEDFLGISVWKETRILHSLDTVANENLWSAKMGLREYNDWILPKVNLNGYQSCLRASQSYGELNGASVNLDVLVRAYRAWLVAKKWLENSAFNYHQIEIRKDQIRYQDLAAQRIIFCEGWKINQNPFFQWVSLRPFKGEIILVKIPSLKTQKILKQKWFIVPVEYPLYWVGSENDKEYVDEEPTSVNKRKLIRALESLLTCSFEVQDHKAAVRPASKDRRPIIGQHPEFQNVYCFNGMGTKGASVAPFWANQFADYLEEGKKLDPFVDISRFLTV